MAQTLKEEVKRRIIEAAKAEFYDKGYEKASMRTIAKRAEMTVGNIYRYFENKEAVHAYITGSTSEDIENAIKKLASHKIIFETSVYGVKPNIKDISQMLDEFADDLVRIYVSNKEEFDILFTDEKSKEMLTNFFRKIFKYIIMTCYPLKKFEKQVGIITLSFANSIFAGLPVYFKEKQESAHSLANMLKIYFRIYASMLDFDIRMILNSLN